MLIALIGAATALGGPAQAGTFWSRQRSDGVVEFTNKQPAGGHWKVLFKTGPGKAAALRGATDLVPPHDVSPARYTRFDRDILDGQAFYGIPEAFIRAVIKTESDFDPRVVSSAGAEGLMQLLPGTARQMGVTDIFDPRQNIMGGTRYLQVLARRFCKTPAAGDAWAEPGSARQSPSRGGTGTLSGSPNDEGRPLTVCSAEEKVKVIAGYQAGPAAVEKYGGIPPYETTHAYVAMVLRRYDQYRTAVGASAEK
jgi:hypothetical protein